MPGPAGHGRQFHHACLLVLLAATSAGALEVEHINVSQSGDSFIVEAESRFDAPPEFIYSILIDYENFYRLANGITSTKLLPPDENGGMIGYTRVESCVWFFCRKVERVERIFPAPHESIATEALPEFSDFKDYRARWTLQRDGHGTRVRFEATMTPDFWLPPLIGPWAIRRKLENSAEQVGERIEYLYANNLDLTDLAGLIDSSDGRRDD